MKQPNLLLITSDQQHWDTLGVTNPLVRTPALDELARQGTRFDRAYCPNPTCSPTRASLITGMYPSLHGCWTIGVKMPEDVPTIGQALGARGYESILVGKAHFQPLKSAPGSESIECQPTLRDLDFWRRFHGPWYGFNRVETARMHGDESHVGQHYAIWMEEHGLKNWRDYFQAWPPSKTPDDRPYYLRDQRHWNLPAQLHHTTWVAQRTIANIERCAQAGKPFLLWSSFFDPHPPYIVSEPWASMYRPQDMRPGKLAPGELDRMPPHFRKTQEKRPDFAMYNEPGGSGLHGFHSQLRDPEELKKDIAAYYGMVSFMDQRIGQILQSLDRLGLADDTLVVFTTDHGHFLGQHGLTAKGPFHYEDMVKVPFLVRWPGKVPSGRVSGALQSLVDVPPTFLRAAGMDVPGIMQGVDQLPVWRGEQPAARDHVIVENRHNPTRMHLRTWIDQRWKITVYRDADFGEMFDLQEDPGEVRNLWDEPALAAQKSRLLHRFVQSSLIQEPTRMPRITGA